MAQRVDQTALRFNQASIITLLLIAFLFDQLWLVAFVGAVMLVGTVWPGAGLFKLVYARLLKPRGLLKPQVIQDDPQPHLFAQGVGGLFLLGSLVALLAGAVAVGWALALIVVALASVNLFLGFCVGCFIHFQLARRGIHLSLPSWQNV
ncbi:MAG: DUF4395 family protein [Caldilineaceae bacterium]|nr:DUF4395 family protein [Caldilineaceae bacterium]